jgi:hypothetical protein
MNSVQNKILLTVSRYMYVYRLFEFASRCISGLQAAILDFSISVRPPLTCHIVSLDPENIVVFVEISLLSCEPAEIGLYSTKVFARQPSWKTKMAD